MVSAQEINGEIDRWIAQENNPFRGGLVVLNRFSDILPADPDEREAYFDFRRWFLLRDFAPILALPKPKQGGGWLPRELDEFGNDTSAFNTMDFKRLHGDWFDKEAYAVDKVYERVKDLAQTHSILSDPEGKKNTFERYKRLVERAFQDQAKTLKHRLDAKDQRLDRFGAVKRIIKLNERIRKSKEIWAEHAFEA